LEKSKAVPGVLGVLVADPNEANAPEPRLKALLALAVGDEIPAVVRGEMELNGLAELPRAPPSWPPKAKRLPEGLRVEGSASLDSEGLFLCHS
jgi:hypothetical protein